jgi:Kyanoviridae head maturation protease
MNFLNGFIEYHDQPLQIIEEANNGKKELFVIGPAAVAGVRNKNNRIYGEGMLDAELRRYITEHVNNKSAWGELCHPAEGMSINPDRISHLFVEFHKDENVWHGKAKVAGTPCGNIVRGLVETGGRLGFSTRGVGSLVSNHQGINEVRDYKIICCDIVTDPSAPGAFVNGVMENVQYYFEGNVLKEAADTARTTLRRAERSGPLTEQQKVRAFQQYISQIVRR